MTRTERFWRAVGGRKMGNGYLGFVALTLMAFPLKATFSEYTFGVLGCLGLTGALVAYEDRKGARPFLARRAADAPEHAPHEWASGESGAGVI